MRDGVPKLRKRAAEGELRRDERDRIARRLRREGRRAREARVDLDDAVILAPRVEGVLDVAFADDAEVAYHPDRDRPQLVILGVREGLRGGDDDALPRVDPHRVEVLHVADRDAVVEGVAHNLILDLFPAGEALLDEHLRSRGESALEHGAERAGAVRRAAPLSAEGVGGAYHDRVADRFSRAEPGLDRRDRGASGREHADPGELLDEELAVLRRDDRRDRSAEDADAVALEDAAFGELDAAVEGRLPAEGEEHAVGALLSDDALDEEGLDGEKVDAVRHPLARLDSGDVGVDEDDLDALLLRRLYGLAPRVVELPRLPDLEGSASEEQHLFDATLFHSSDSR